MAAGYNDGSLWIFDTDSGRPVIPPMRGHRGAMEAPQFSSNGHRIASAGVNRTVRVWNADTGQPIAESRPEHTDTIVQLVFSPDGRRLLSTSSENTMRLWDTDSDAFVGKPLSGFESYFSRVAFSPDGQRLVPERVLTSTVGHQELATRRQAASQLQHSSAVWPSARMALSLSPAAARKAFSDGT